MGLTVTVIGLASGAASLGLGLGGWPIERLWFYLLTSAMSLIVGVQLALFWVIMQVLAELSERQVRIAEDMQGKACRG
jgi:hypothetical protein